MCWLFRPALDCETETGGREVCGACEYDLTGCAYGGRSAQRLAVGVELLENVSDMFGWSDADFFFFLESSRMRGGPGGKNLRAFRAAILESFLNVCEHVLGTALRNYTTNPHLHKHW